MCGTVSLAPAIRRLSNEHDARGASSARASALYAAELGGLVRNEPEPEAARVSGNEEIVGSDHLASFLQLRASLDVVGRVIVGKHEHLDVGKAMPAPVAGNGWTYRTRPVPYCGSLGFCLSIRFSSSGVSFGRCLMKWTSFQPSSSPFGEPSPHAGIPVKRTPYSMM
jgi:hypothetical protein